MVLSMKRRSLCVCIKHLEFLLERRNVSFLDEKRKKEEEEEALFLDAVKGVKFHATHTRDRLTASAATRMRCGNQEGRFRKSEDRLKVPGKLPETA